VVWTGEVEAKDRGGEDIIFLGFFVLLILAVALIGAEKCTISVKKFIEVQKFFTFSNISFWRICCVTDSPVINIMFRPCQVLQR